VSRWVFDAIKKIEANYRMVLKNDKIFPLPLLQNQSRAHSAGGAASFSPKLTAAICTTTYSHFKSHTAPFDF